MTSTENKYEGVLHDNSFVFNPDVKITYGLIIVKTVFGDYLQKLWSNAQCVVVCDGAANQLHALEEKHKLLPEVVIGDLDSITPPVLDFYKSKNVKIQVEPDQDKTDLMKAIEYLLAKPVAMQPDVIVCYGGFTGRFDHLMGNINALHKYGSSKRVVLLQEGKMVELLVPGKHTILCNRAEVNVSCGLMPFAGPARVASTGLRWNLRDQVMSFGGLVSTSNIVEDPVITLDTTAPLIWNTAFGATKKPR